MDIKVGRKYKRVGTYSNLLTETGEIVTVHQMTSRTISFYRELYPRDRSLMLYHTTFTSEFIQLNKPLNFKGLYNA